MMRTTHFGRRFREFAGKNDRLLFLLALFIIGIVVGVRLFSPENADLRTQLAAMLGDLHSLGGISDAMAEMASACALPAILTLLCGIAGLSACGVPMTLFCVIVYGISVGLSEAYLYAQGPGGVVAAILLFLPHTVVGYIAILMAASESMRMSLLLCKKLLPNGTGTALFSEFRLFGLRYAVFFLLIPVGGFVDIGCRLLFGRLVELL